MAAPSSSAGSSVRKRRVDSSKTEAKPADVQDGDGADSATDSSTDPSTDPGTGRKAGKLRTGTFWLTRIVLLRSVAFIYCKQSQVLSCLQVFPHLCACVSTCRHCSTPSVSVIVIGMRVELLFTLDLLKSSDKQIHKGSFSLCSCKHIWMIVTDA